MKKVLFVATVVKKHIMEFHLPYLRMFHANGWQTAVAARNDYDNKDNCQIPNCDSYFDMPFCRTPLSFQNISCYFKMKKLVQNEKYDIVHCHTPVAAFLTRLACIKSRKSGTKIIYTAHGFHFYKGAPLLNWFLWFPAEWLTSFFTDVLITINKEDYLFAKKHLHAKETKYVPGVGVDCNALNNALEDESLKKRLGIKDDVPLLLAVGELNANKNHISLINAISKIPSCALCIAGDGDLRSSIQQSIDELGLSNRVFLLGYRDDIPYLMKNSDIFVFPSFREGLSLALMEAMACAKPIACSNVRGNRDLIRKGGGELFDPYDVEDIKRAIEVVISSDWGISGEINVRAVQKYSLDNVLDIMSKIYFDA